MKSLAALSLCLLAAATALGQGRFYVRAGATGDGSSWGQASGDLAGLMATAVTGTEIWVQEGTYYPTACMGPCTDADRLASFRLRRGVRVVGGFSGSETDAAAATPTNVTILSGDIGRAGDPSDNVYSVVYCLDCGRDAALANVTITGGNANRPQSNITQRGAAGAGVYLDGAQGRVASPTLTDCAVVNNDSRGQGGGLYLNGFSGGEASPRLERCLVAFNTSRADGGGMYVLALEGTASPLLTETTLRRNGTVNPGTSSGQSGAALYVSATAGTADVRLDRCLLTRNSADISTPGFGNGNASANGGAVYLAAAAANPNLRLTATNTVLSHNTAYSGGAVYNNRGTVSFTNVSVVGNRALGTGGSGAGLYINAGTASVANAVFADNEVPNNGSAGRDFRFVNGALAVRHTLLAAESRAAAFSCSTPGCGNDAYDEGPGVIYGAAPVLVDPAADVPEFQATSPAQDAGDDALVVAGSGDYYGHTRIAGAAVDLGAVERGGGALPVELVAFDAAPDGGAVRITWTSSSEVDLAGYRVLRSDDGADFSQIGETLAMGSGEYAFTDRTARPGRTYYYRLRSVDHDGSYDLSAIVSATLDAGADNEVALAEVFPNPASTEVRLTLTPRDDARAVYATLYDATGRKVRLWALTTDGEHALPVTDLPEGAYVLHLAEGDDRSATPLLIRH